MTDSYVYFTIANSNFQQFSALFHPKMKSSIFQAIIEFPKKDASIVLFATIQAGLTSYLDAIRSQVSSHFTLATNDKIELPPL